MYSFLPPPIHIVSFWVTQPCVVHCRFQGFLSLVKFLPLVNFLFPKFSCLALIEHLVKLNYHLQFGKKKTFFGCFNQTPHVLSSISSKYQMFIFQVTFLVEAFLRSNTKDIGWWLDFQLHLLWITYWKFWLLCCGRGYLTRILYQTLP
jgi:hypothetical protein